MSQSSVPRGILKLPLSNGVGRYVNQLQRITLKLCKHKSSSYGIREYIASERIIDFAKRYPSTAVYVKPRFGRGALLVAEYLNGYWQHQNVSYMSADEIQRWMELMATRSGYDIDPIHDKVRRFHGSVQGMWHPHLHRPPGYADGDTGKSLVENWPQLNQHVGHRAEAKDIILDLYRKQLTRMNDENS